MIPESAPSEIAYYYPEPYWLLSEGSWIKSLLLFFDEIAILLPEYMRGRELAEDPTLAGPLADQHLLRILEPEWFVDDVSTQKLTDLIGSLIEAGAFDSLKSSDEFAALSMSRMGFGAIAEAANRIFESLRERGLANATEDKVSIRMHPVVRAVYLVALAQLARDAGVRHGLDLHPTTNRSAVQEIFQMFLGLQPMPTRSQIVSFDLEVVSIDLDQVPLDEVLQFRNENREPYRKYMQDLREFEEQLSLKNAADRARALRDRSDDLKDQARTLRGLSWQAWRKPSMAGGFALGLTGAAYSVATGSLVPGVIGALTAAVAMLPDPPRVNTYTYLFKAANELR